MPISPEKPAGRSPSEQGRAVAFVFVVRSVCDGMKADALAPGMRASARGGRPELVFCDAQLASIHQGFAPGEHAQAAMALGRRHVGRVKRWVDEGQAFVAV